MILSMGTVLLFRTSDRIVSAYGVAVSIVMTLSTISVSIVVHKVWELHWSITAIFLIVYAFIDGSYLTSNLLKAQSWGWYTIIISVVLVSLMVTWRWGKLLTLKASKKKSRTAKHLYKGLLEKRHDFSDGNQDYTVHNWNTFNNLGEIRKYSSTIGKGHTEKNRNVMLNKHYMQRTDNGAEEYQGLVKIPGACVFYTNQHGNVPPVFYQYLETFPAVFSVTAFLHIRRAIVPYVVSHERLRVMELRYEGFYSVVATFGYMDAIEPGEKLASEIFAGLRHLEIVNCRDEIEYNAMMENAEKRPPSVSAQTGHAATSDVDPIIPVGSQPKDSDIFERSNVPLPYEIEFEVAPGVKAGRAEDSTAADHQNIRDNSRVFYGSTTKTADPVYSGAKRDPLTHLNIRINQLAHAYSTGVTYIISESHLFADKGKKWAIFPGLRRYLIETVFNFMNFMTVSATTLHDIPLNRSVVLSAKLEG